jgi:hypothetical protein
MPPKKKLKDMPLPSLRNKELKMRDWSKSASSTNKRNRERSTRLSKKHRDRKRGSRLKLRQEPLQWPLSNNLKCIMKLRSRMIMLFKRKKRSRILNSHR